MSVTIDGTLGITSPAETTTNLAYTGTLTGGTGIVNLGSGQVYKDASGNVGIGTSSPAGRLDISSSGSTLPTLKLSGAWTGAARTGLKIINTNTSAGNVSILSIASGAVATGSLSVYGTEYTGVPQLAGKTGVEATSGGGAFISSVNNPIYFYTGAGGVTEQMQISSSGNVTLQNNISVGAAAPTTSGTGITFPATQSASTDANTLDDYEEGTWTPNQGAGLTVVGTFGSSGTYTKIGRLVTAIGAITPTTSVASSNGGVISTNLPFTSGSAAAGSVADANGNGGSVISQTAGTTILSYPSHTASAALWFTITYFI